MAAVNFNEIQNAFIDALSFGDLPQSVKTDLLMAVPPGHDRMCAAVISMLALWRNEWSKGGNNFDKAAIIEHVEESRELLIQQQEDKELIDETRISVLLSDMIPAFKNGTYMRIVEERNEYLAAQMADFLTKREKAVPQILTAYLSEHQDTSKPS
jgi:pheromone shutdown protein TraB